MRNATVTTNEQGRGRTAHPRPSRLLRRIGIVAVLIPAGACAGLPGARTSAPASVRLHGTGDTASTRVALPANWTAAWHFSCRGADQGQPFALVATEVGESHRSFDVIRQTGLSGGGQQQYKAPGDYVFKVTTPCDWTLDAGGAQDKSVKQPASAGSTTSTTPTTATTTEHAEASGPSPWPRAALR